MAKPLWAKSKHKWQIRDYFQIVWEKISLEHKMLKIRNDETQNSGRKKMDKLYKHGVHRKKER